jgi:hypothetical protein
MASVKVFSNLSLNGVAGPQNLAAATVYSTAGVPTKGARAIVFRFKATNANAPASASINVGNSPLRAELFLSPGSIGYSGVLGNAGVRADQTGGNTIALFSSNARGIFFHDYAQVSITSHATLQINGFSVDAEVWYDHDADEMQKSLGLGTVVVSTA